MNKSDYKYIENRLNEMCKHDVKIIYDKNNSETYYDGNDIAWDKITFKVYGYGSCKMIITKKYNSYSNLIDIFYVKYLNMINGVFKNGK